MEEDTRHTRVSRRAFLRALAGAAGAIAAAPLLQTGAPSAVASAPAGGSPTRNPLRVGVLLPEPPSYPEMGPSFLAGMQLYLAQSGGHIELVVRDGGILPDRALEQLRTLLQPAQVDLAVGMMRSGVASALHPLLAEHQIPLIVSGAGANLTRQADARPYILRNTLGSWRASWALGDWAARNLGSTALIATSFYDSGYDANYLFQLGFEGAGGTILGTQMTHRPAEAPERLSALISGIREQQPDMVFAGYAGSAAVEFVRAYDAARLSEKIPLLGGGFLADERHLHTLGGAGRGIKTALPWAAALGTAANRDFSASYRAVTGRPPDTFAVLGYDTAQLIVTAASASGGETGASLQQALANAMFDGPRGPVAMDPHALDVTTPLYLREIRAAGSRLRNVVIGELASPPLLDARFQPVRATTKTGWQNAYLCV